MAVIYKGFTTVGKDYPPYSLTDIDLVKQDILNEFNTKVGERVMLPSFGSVIHEIIMDPLDEISKSAILEDVRKVISNEPRVQIVDGDIVLTEIDNGVRINIALLFVPQDTADHLILEFEREIREGI